MLLKAIDKTLDQTDFLETRIKKKSPKNVFYTQTQLLQLILRRNLKDMGG